MSWSGWCLVTSVYTCVVGRCLLPKSLELVGERMAFSVVGAGWLGEIKQKEITLDHHLRPTQKLTWAYQWPECRPSCEITELSAETRARRKHRGCFQCWEQTCPLTEKRVHHHWSWFSWLYTGLHLHQGLLLSKEIALDESDKANHRLSGQVHSGYSWQKAPAQNVWRTETNDEEEASNSIKVFGAVWFSEGREWVSINRMLLWLKDSPDVARFPDFRGFGANI